MRKRGGRPWERRGIGRRHNAGPPESKYCSRPAATAANHGPVPSVQLPNGTTYSSDRFYLNAHDESSIYNSSGASSTVVLFDRAQLVASLDLVAAMVGTYTLNPAAISKELPALFSSRAVVPTLVLHGHKGLSAASRRGIPTRTVSPSTVTTTADFANLLPPTVATLTPNPKYAKVRTERCPTTGEDVVCIDDSDDEDEASFTLSKNDISSLSNNHVNVTHLSNKPLRTAKVKQEDDIPPEEGWRSQPGHLDNTSLSSLFNDKNGGSLFGDSVHLTEVLSTWVPPLTDRETEQSSSSSSKQCSAPQHSSSSSFSEEGAVSRNPSVSTKKDGDKESVIVIDSSDEENDSGNNISVGSPDVVKMMGVDDHIVSRRKHCRGVHHPKFLILFERRGSIVVVVSTANMTRRGATDASWVQRFEPRPPTHSDTPLSSNDDSSRKPHISSAMRHDGSDFGLVLANLLECQSHAAAVDEMTPVQFLQRYMNLASLEDFASRYDFSTSQVHLIATVPGEYPGRHSVTHLGRKKKVQPHPNTSVNRHFLYGPQRVADLMSRLGKSCLAKDGPPQMATNPWLSTQLLSDEHDRLLMQTTSLGGNWTRQSLEEVARSYLGRDGKKSKSTSTSTMDHASELIDSIDILWPTQESMNEYSSESTLLSNSDTTTSAANKENKPTFCFLSSTSFSSIDLSCISRMVLYEKAVPPPLSPFPSPHIKTFGRLLRKSENSCPERERFGWIMMTSACLSRGAQGTAVKHRGFESDAMAYSNFELGILFCSRVQGDPLRDRIYGYHPHPCTCCNNEGTHKTSHSDPLFEANFISLPIPYKLRPSPYQPDDDDADFAHTPFFHEIPDGTGTIGQMTLTPLGRMLASQHDN